ncbi:alpha/beta hydrolase [Mucilaginibacter achroorhodeus]|uniref:Alpha/beta hydrolase n=1 Tax=Mucilaginibacter achroorhodeus TaxID=2599294 RepID=A0A563U602_9SPHI|nr:alpha/beta hydrolase [Mucilaginibacter achroorhodeus]TWR26744.1 alpha/beta hydrolase [Mucilaginibacter achroorhodeus]
MKFITSKDSGGIETKIFYEDLGHGRPVILIHGWPLDHTMWDYQVAALTDAGFRCIAYDRRGFGKSNKPLTGYDYDTLTSDLKALIDELQLEDVVLIGFSMGGGEVVKYFSNYGGHGVAKAVLISSIAPFMLQTDDNPDGVPQEQIDQIAANIQEDRPGFLGSFGKQFYGVGLLNNPVSEQRLTFDLICAMQATLKSTLECAVSFSSTDLRGDISSVNVPTLIIHGDDDKTVPIQPTGEQAAKLISGSEFIIYEGEPHGLFITAKDRLNADLIDFISR